MEKQNLGPKTVLRIRDVYPGSECSPSRMRIFPSRSRIRIKEFKYIFDAKIVSTLSEIWSGLFIPDPNPDPDFFTHPGSRIQGSKRHRIRIRNTAQKRRTENLMFRSAWRFSRIKQFHLEATLKRSKNIAGFRIRIRINWSRRIRIQNADPDPGGQKWPTRATKIKKSKVSCLEVLDVLF